MKIPLGIKSLGLFFCFFAMPFIPGFGQSAEHFFNPPENINADPHYVPGDFALPDTNAARILYQIKKQELAASLKDNPNAAVTLGMGEISFISTKNESAEVLGYFRNYFGIAKIQDGNFEKFEMVIDLDSLDTGLPGRNNRILALFFQSMKPELGTATIKFDRLETDGKSLAEAEENTSLTVRASGELTLNGVTKPVSAELSLTKQNQMWIVETKMPVFLMISDFGFKEQIYKLMKSCNHKSVSNKVQVNVTLYLK